MSEHAPSERWLGRIGAIAAVVIVGAFVITVLVAELAWMLSHEIVLWRPCR
jgi:hypothetical protein